MQTKILAKKGSLGICSKPVFTVALLIIAISGCTMTETQQRVGTGAVGGAAIGAAAGGILGGRSGAGVGALVGTAVGAGGGYLVDQNKKRQAAEAETRRLREENRRLREQQQQ